MFKKRMRLTAAAVMLTMIGSMLLNGCSGSIKGSSSSSKDIMTVEYNNFSMEFDYTNYTFVIRSNDGDKNKSWEGKLLTHDCPKTANVYKAEPWENSNVPFHNPI